MRISGEGGRLRVGYQTAARLGRWHLTRVRVEPQAYEATATLSDIDTFWIDQRPMTLELQIGGRVWAWLLVEPRMNTESLAVTLDGGPLIH